LRLEPPGRVAGAGGDHEGREGRPRHARRRRRRAALPQFHRPEQGGRRRAFLAQGAAPVPHRQGRPPGDGAGDRQGHARQAALRADGRRHAERADRAEELPLTQHEVRVQHPEGEPDAGRRRVQEGCGWHPGDQGRRADEGDLRHLDQHAAPEGAGAGQGRLEQDRHRVRAEVGRRRRLLRRRRRAARQHQPLLLGHDDVHVDLRVAVPDRLYEAVVLGRPGARRGAEGERLARHEPEPLDQRRLQQALGGGGEGDRPGQVEAAVHADERHGRQQLRERAVHQPQLRVGYVEGAEGTDHHPVRRRDVEHRRLDQGLTSQVQSRVPPRGAPGFSFSFLEEDMATKIGRRRVVLRGLAGALLAACGGSAPTPPVPAAAPAAKPTEAAQGAPEPTRPATAASSAATAGAVPAATKPSAPPAASAATPAAGAAAAPPKRGGGGTLKLLYWQGPTILNRHLAVGVKDNHAARLCTEPLITMDPEGKWIPVLAAEVPSQRNGGLAEDGKSVTYKLKKDVKWADGSPFTADDVVFTWQFVIDPATAATTISQFAAVSKVEAIDPLTVKISFKDPNPAWFVPFSNSGGAILPKAAFKDYQGAKAKDAPFNLKAYGTGPYKVDDFKPGDLVVYKINPNYREPNKPFFDVVQI